jgi:hypothetical protein
MGKGGKMMYYKIVGPTVIKNPTVPPDNAWIDGMKDWALGATVLFIKFTAKHGNEYGARVKICEIREDCELWPNRKLTRLELPYSWLEPFPNYFMFEGAPGHVHPRLKNRINMR